MADPPPTFIAFEYLSVIEPTGFIAILWKIEKAVRISETHLRIRPIYHRLRLSIETHICIAFTTYGVFKELEWVLKKENFTVCSSDSRTYT